MSMFCSLATAKRVAAELTGLGIGGGVLPYNPETAWEASGEPDPNEPPDPRRSGIYVPAYTGPLPTPGDEHGDYGWALRFANGAEGFLAANVLWMQETSPARWMLMLANEVNQQGAARRRG